MFQKAVNYVFTGRIDPPDAPEIVNLNSCVVVVHDLKYQRYVRYYLSRFKMDVSRISKEYSGSQISYVLEVEGDEVIIEFLNGDRTSVAYGLKSAQISLPGDIDQTQRALRYIFDGHCRPERPKAPF